MHGNKCDFGNPHTARTAAQAHPSPICGAPAPSRYPDAIAVTYGGQHH